ncbi:hypothetical protein [Salinispora pacifica]|uniref:hypothetical protein n=1 Tax=Salinispora pacifica TaxID=351187 RepID=UPI00036017B3|nr:hypothetical protein [Salinispora pacifica]
MARPQVDGSLPAGLAAQQGLYLLGGEAVDLVAVLDIDGPAQRPASTSTRTWRQSGIW